MCYRPFCLILYTVSRDARRVHAPRSLHKSYMYILPCVSCCRHSPRGMLSGPNRISGPTALFAAPTKSPARLNKFTPLIVKHVRKYSHFRTPSQLTPSGLSQQGASTAVPLDHPHAALTPPTVGIDSATPQDGPAAPTTHERRCCSLETSTPLRISLASMARHGTVAGGLPCRR